MGTINYFTSDYITLAVKPGDIDDILFDADFIADCNEKNLTPEEREKYAHELIDLYAEDDRANVECILKDYDFYYYHVVIKPGYYEGFSIYIENNFGLCYDSFLDKRDAQKEITQIKRFLIDCAGCGLVSCNPGWCTTYGDYKSTLKDIDAAILEMREEARSIPTWNQYKRESA